MAAEKYFLKMAASDVERESREREARPLTHYHVSHANRLKAVFDERVPPSVQTSFVLPPALKVLPSPVAKAPLRVPPHLDGIAQALTQWANGSGPRVLWLFGPSGSGKTFLLENCLVPHAADVRVSTCDRFFSDWVSGFRTNRPTPLLEYKTRAKMLILESLETLCTRGKTQIELLRTVEAIHARGGAVAVSSVGSPASMSEHLAPQLVSKLSSGLVFELPQVPSEGIAETVAQELPGHDAAARDELCRALAGRRWLSYSAQRAFFLNFKVRLDSGVPFRSINVEELLRLTNGDGTMSQTQVTPEAILEKTCALFGVSVADVKGPRRTRHVGDARLFCYRALHELAGLTQSDIAELLRRDPSSVNKGIQQVRHRTELSPALQRRWQWVKDFVAQAKGGEP